MKKYTLNFRICVSGWLIIAYAFISKRDPGSILDPGLFPCLLSVCGHAVYFKGRDCLFSAEVIIRLPHAAK